MTAEKETIRCIKCNTGVGHDGRGWEKIFEYEGCTPSEIWVCPNCIYKFQAVKDIRDFLKIDKIKVLDYPKEARPKMGTIEHEMLVKIHELIDTWEIIRRKFH